jgi:preprotein translocase subunit SecY
MGIAIPYLQNFKMMVRVVEKRLIRLRWLTIVITLVQDQLTSIIYRTLPSSAFLLGFNSFEFLFSSVIILVTIFAMWLGEK